MSNRSIWVKWKEQRKRSKLIYINLNSFPKWLISKNVKQLSLALMIRPFLSTGKEFILKAS